MDELKRLLEEGCTSDSRMAAQIRMLARAYITEAEKREAEFVRKEAGFKAKKAEFKAAEEKYLAEIVNLTNQNLEKDKFLSIVAHDLRGPLGNFLGLSEALEEGANTMSAEELQSIAGAMHRSAKNLFQFLEDLLGWAKARTNRFDLNFQKTYLGAIALKVRMYTAESARAKGINIEDKISVDSEFKCDWFVVETILRNLVGNAIKFSKKGGKIIISSEMTEKNVEISVSDTGIGMSKEMVGKIFQLNSDTQRPGTANEKSSGLGLLLCKEFVELHGGKIWAESKEGIGSVFHFTIPLSLGQNPDLSTTPHNQVLAANN